MNLPINVLHCYIVVDDNDFEVTDDKKYEEDNYKVCVEMCQDINYTGQAPLITDPPTTSSTTLSNFFKDFFLYFFYFFIFFYVKIKYFDT